MNLPENPLTLADYAEKVGREISSVRRWILRGNSKTATKVGRDWFVSADEPYIDGRIKTGQYVNWRKPKE